MARVTVAFDGVRDGQIHPERFDVGSVVTGELARVAIAEGWAEDDTASLLPTIEQRAQKGLEGVYRRIREILAWFVNLLGSTR